MEAGAEAQQVESTEKETDPYEEADHGKHAGRAHRQDHDTKSQGNEAIG
jgi:hypothetical protein